MGSMTKQKVDFWNFAKAVRSGVGRDGSVGIATRYGLDVPGIESRWEEVFRTRPI
jgi:hypothetical protein